MHRVRAIVRSLLIAGVLLAGFSGRPAAAQYFGQNKVQFDKFDFKVLKTEHFDIHYYSSEEEAAKQVARMAERWNTRLSRVLTHQLSSRQVVVLYGSHPEFEQTNVVEGLIDEGTGGVTEGLRRRVVLPLAASLGETDHVLGHELVHAFQYDILGQNAEPAPLWFIEGMAEYLSLGPRNAQTAMWLRDAAYENKLPKLQDLDNPEYFPYRFGHAFWAYVGGRWGDATVGNILHRLAIGAGPAGRSASPIGVIEAATGLSRDALSTAWQQSILAAYDVTPRDRSVKEPRDPRVFGERSGSSGLNVGPQLSPDGTKMAFLSGRGLLSIDLYIADAASGKILHKLTHSDVDTHFQSLQFLASAGSWSPDGERLAVATVRTGRPVLTIFSTRNGNIVQEIRMDERGEIFQPAWSPDGQSIAFSAQIGGLTDLYLYEFGPGRIRRLTTDDFADLQPTWNPDGRSLTFVTDRYTSNLDILQFGNYRLAQLDVATGRTSELQTALTANVFNPQWALNGSRLYVISDLSGRPEVYSIDPANGRASRTTNELTGVAGITPLSPALSIAHETGQAAITVFHDSGYEIHLVDALERIEPVEQGQPRMDYAALPPARTESLVAQQLASPRVGLPEPGTAETEPYSTGLSLVDVGQQVGVSTSSTFGTYVAGGISLLFSDVLGNHLLSTSFDVNGGVKDIAAQVAYLNRTSRWNWTVFGERVPLLSGTVQAGLTSSNGQLLYEEDTILDRQTYTQFGGGVAYPFSRATRLEFNATAQHIGFNQELQTDIFDPNSGVLLAHQTQDLGGQPGLNLAQVGAALVRDNSSFGIASPILGQRFRFEADPTFGDLRMTNVTLDYRRYAMPFRPVTFAARVLHVGRYGGGSEDARLFPLFLGYSTLVRGYDPNSFTAGECTVQADGSCPEFDRLLGSRIVVANGEIRAPAWGLFSGKLSYGPIPAELFAFFDSGVAWTRDLTPSFAGGTRDWVSSTGVGARVNVFGYLIAEFNAAHPLNRHGRGWMFVFNLRPGF
jgi:Tol biopolymer transport system component